MLARAIGLPGSVWQPLFHCSSLASYLLERSQATARNDQAIHITTESAVLRYMTSRASHDRPVRQMAGEVSHPTFAEAFRFWVKLGFISFGGPTGQIAIMQTELVEKKKWISQSRFLHALNFCMLLPGPEATQLAIYIGWLLHRTWGGIVAGAFFVVPSIFVLWVLSFVYAAYGALPWIAAIFYGLKPAVMAIV